MDGRVGHGHGRIPAIVLVADDEKNIRMTLVQALSGPGVRVLTAVSGEDVLARLDTEDVDVLLLDLAMPGIDGIDVLRRVAAQRPRTRVVIITAHGSVRTAVEAMKLGAVDFIEKPFAPREVREAVRLALAGSPPPDAAAAGSGLRDGRKKERT